MPVSDSDLALYYPENISNTAANGGRMSTNICPNSQGNNVWPQVTIAERLAGSTVQRKVFAKNSNPDQIVLANGKVFLDQTTPGDDWVIFAEATQTDTQGDWLASADKFGCGKLNADVVATGLTLVVDLEDDTLKSGDNAIFRVGDLIRITDKYLPSSETGAEEYLTIDTVTPHGSLAQVTITTTTALINPYTVAADARVSSVLEPGDVGANFTDFDASGASGTYDIGSYPLELENESTIEDTWTFNFTDATNFTCTGATAGNVGSGVIGSDFAPDNTDFSKPFFTFAAAGHGGTYQAGDSITVDTHPSSVPIREIRVVPAACASLSANKAMLCFTGESA